MPNNSLEHLQQRIEKKLSLFLQDASAPQRLIDAMRYSTLQGGKRFRALLSYGAGLTVNAELTTVDYVSSAVECIHAYSLIHDDLPAMDDDDLRRGKASNHKYFDEATAILSGDGLLTLAFNIINRDDCPLNDQQCRKITQHLSQKAGINGMVGGQMLDMLANDTLTEIAHLERIHNAKTGALINASVICGALCSPDVSQKHLQHLRDYAMNLGLAFQVVDDILDIESSTKTLGKESRSDEVSAKATYPALLGLAQSKILANKLHKKSLQALETLPYNTVLVTLANLNAQRTH